MDADKGCMQVQGGVQSRVDGVRSGSRIVPVQPASIITTPAYDDHDCLTLSLFSLGRCLNRPPPIGRLFLCMFGGAEIETGSPRLSSWVAMSLSHYFNGPVLYIPGVVLDHPDIRDFKVGQAKMELVWGGYRMTRRNREGCA